MEVLLYAGYDPEVLVSRKGVICEDRSEGSGTTKVGLVTERNQRHIDVFAVEKSEAVGYEAV